MPRRVASLVFAITVVAATSAGNVAVSTTGETDDSSAYLWRSPISEEQYEVTKIEGMDGYHVEGPAGTFTSFDDVIDAEIEASGLPAHLFKAERELREAFLRSERGARRVIVVLSDQPMAELAPGIWARHMPGLERMSAQLRAARTEREHEALAAGLKKRRDAIRNEIFREAGPALKRSQKAAMAALRGAGGLEPRPLSFTLNALLAEIRTEGLDRVTALGAVARVGIDGELQHMLDVSVPTTGRDAPGSWSFNGVDGGSSVVAIVDAGVDFSHPALVADGHQSHIVLTEAVSKSCFNDNANSSDDLTGHGTHIGGIIRSVGTAAFPKNLGMATGVRLINLKSGWRIDSNDPGCVAQYETGAGMVSSDAVANMDWAALQASPKADVVSFSWGTQGDHEYNEMALYLDALAWVHNIAVAVSAGNQGPNPETTNIEASVYNQVAVGNADDMNTLNVDDDALRVSSSRGPTYLTSRTKPDIVAPGTSIMSTSNTWEGAGADFVSLSGTSMSAPHAAGAAALALDAGMVSVLEWKTTIMNAARNELLGGSGQPDNNIGRGYMDVSRHWFAYAGPFPAQPPFYVSGQVTKGSPRFYHVFSPLISEDRFTLHWQADTVTLQAGDLDLEVWSESTGTQYAVSSTPKDNVEFLRGGGFGDAHDNVFKVESQSATVDLFGFASSRRIGERTPPSLSITSIDLSAQVNSGDRFYVHVTVENAGDLRARSVTLPFQWSPGAPVNTLESSPVVIPSIAGHDDATLTLSVDALEQGCGAPASLQVGAGYSQSYHETYTIPMATATTQVVCS